MGLFDIFKKKEINNQKDYDTISDWLNDILKEKLPSKIKAINFKLYDDGDNKWSIELIASSKFDEKDSDYACEEIYTTRDNPFAIIREDSWKNIELMVINMIKNYLQNGEYANKLKEYDAIGIGFVDGDIKIIYKRY